MSAIATVTITAHANSKVCHPGRRLKAGSLIIGSVLGGDLDNNPRPNLGSAAGDRLLLHEISTSICAVTLNPSSGCFVTPQRHVVGGASSGNAAPTKARDPLSLN